MAGRMVVGYAALAGLVRPASAPDPAGGHRVLPVAPELTGLLPNRGLRRGSTVAVAEHSFEREPQPAAVPLAQLPHAGPVARLAQGERRRDARRGIGSARTLWNRG